MTKMSGKMTLTFDSEVYGQLLNKYQPRLIQTEEENEKFLAIVEELMSRPHLIPEEDLLLNLLIKLIEDFENEHYQIDTSTPHSRLLHLMEAHDLEKDDLAKVFGSMEIIDKIINEHQEIDIAQAEALGELFHVKPSLFI